MYSYPIEPEDVLVLDGERCEVGPIALGVGLLENRLNVSWATIDNEELYYRKESCKELR